MRRAAVAVVAVLGALPGSARAADVTVHPFAATAADGAVLRGDVYVPQTGGRVGTVLNLSPYWNGAHSPQTYGPSDQQLAMGDRSLQGALTKLTGAGFAVALVNMRGSGKSDGCLPYGDPIEWTDAATVVQGLAAQPWSNGDVGMYGGSYHGWSQYMAMAARPPALKAIVPFSGIIDLWSLLTRNGAFYAAAAESNEGAVAAQSSLGSLDPAGLQRPGCLADTQAHAAAFQQLAADGDKTGYWRKRDLRAAIRDAPIPAFVANGLATVGEGHLTQFDGLWGLLAPSRTRFLLGQWGHDWPSAYRSDYLDMIVTFFDQYLRDGPGRLKLGVVEYQDDAQAWHTADRWPPRGHSLALRLSDTALVPDAAPVQDAPRAYASSPEDTGLRCGGHEVEYASAPLAEDLLVAGNFRLDVTLSSGAAAGNLIAVLLHGTGTGACESVATGAVESGRAQIDLRHTAQLGTGRDFPIDRPTRVTVDSMPLVTRIRKGQRLFLAIGGGSAVLVARGLPAVTVRAGSLVLPVVDEHDQPQHAAAPASVGLGADGSCRDDAAPRSVFVAASMRIRGGRLGVRGRSTDRVCGVASVRVALARQAGRGRCRFLTASGRLGRPRSCGRPVLLPVTGTGIWRFAPAGRLPAGRYRLLARATDTAGHVERTSRAMRFRIRRS